MFGSTFSKVSKSATKKAPSFFDSSYYLRNYVGGPDLFTANNSNSRASQGRNSNNNSGHSFPNYQYGLYSYYSTLQIDPHTSGIVTLFSTGSNTNHEEEVGQVTGPALSASKYSPRSIGTVGSTLEVPEFITKSVSSGPISFKRAYATASKIHAIPADLPSIQESQDQHEQETLPRHVYDKEIRKRHLDYLEKAMSLKNLDSTLRTLLQSIQSCVQQNKSLEILSLFQAIKRNGLRVPVEVYNIVLYATFIRTIPGGETIESRMTSILDIYSDMLASKLKPNIDTYEVVLSTLLEGAFDSFEIYLNHNGIEKFSDDGEILYKKIGDGKHYFQLAFELFLASNFTKFQNYHEKIFESVLLGLSIFGYEFNDVKKFSDFYAMINSHMSLKNGNYFINMIKIAHKADADVISEIYNQYKESSKWNNNLLPYKYDVYGVLLWCLNENGNYNVATKILDDILIDSKSNESLNTKEKLEKPIVLYLIGLIESNKIARSFALFEKFVQFKLLSLSGSYTKQFFINMVVKSCEMQDLGLAKKSFQSLMPCSINEEDFLFAALTRKSDSSANTFSKAVSSYMNLCIENDLTEEVEMIFNKYQPQLNIESSANLMIYLINKNYDEKLIMKVINSYENDVNELLSLLVCKEQFLDFVNRDLDQFVSSRGFWRCNTEFSLRSYVQQLESARMITDNKFYGLLYVWNEFWNVTSPQTQTKPAMTLLAEQFDSMENLSLIQSLKREENSSDQISAVLQFGKCLAERIGWDRTKEFDIVGGQQDAYQEREDFLVDVEKFLAGGSDLRV